jgi:cob(I)alamin adenosyltransferase
MKIYTKTGDEGKTSLFGGEKVDKNNIRIKAYGTVDELNSVIGLSLTEDVNIKTREILVELQHTLFLIGGELATPPTVNSSAIKHVSDNEISFIEKKIDELEIDLSPLKNFILPGGSKAAAILHLARTVCRRAEREIVEIDQNEKINKKVIIYINRLSDLLFVMARFENHVTSTPETEWNTRG